MYAGYSLNKEILKMLLLYLLDLRATTYWAKSLWQEGRYFYRPQDHYSLIDQLAPHFDKSFQHLVKDRLQSLSLQNSNETTYLLEKAQLLAWKTLLALEEESETLQTGKEKHFFEKRLQETVEALVKLQDRLKSFPCRWSKRRLRHSVEFLTRGIRLEMKEIHAPQDKVEMGITLMEKAYASLESAADFLEKKQLFECYKGIQQALTYRPYSLNHQILELFAFLLIRFARASEKLKTSHFLQKPSYRLYLLERADKALKRSCQLLRLFHHESRLNSKWQELFRKQVTSHWHLMVERLEQEMASYGRNEAIHWILWSHLSIYKLGLDFSGQRQPLTAVEEAIDWLQKDSQVKNVQIRLVVSLIILIQESFEQPQLSQLSIERVRCQLEMIHQTSPSLVPSLERCLQDLCLLYSRVETSHELVLQASGRLLAVSWDLQSPETTVACLQCLEDFFDIWTGSSLKALS